MNKKALFPLTLLPLAATYLQVQNNGSLRSECTDKRPRRSRNQLQLCRS